MHTTLPQVFLVGETRVIWDNLRLYLESIGAGDWDTDAPSDLEALSEAMGRLCYRSFKPGLNPNVTRVREGNGEHLMNIIRSGHHSVLEHSVLNFIFHNVSRVLTHELVRHRVGIAVSQESLRYVRLNELGFFLPRAFLEHEKSTEILNELLDGVRATEERLAKLEKILEFSTLDFAEKKKLTSAMRRIAPIGLSTSIGWSANIRELRHVILLRTSRHAEEEIRLVFATVADIVKRRYPNAFADLVGTPVDGCMEYVSVPEF